MNELSRDIRELVDPITARRAVGAVDADIIAAGGTAEQGGAVRAALWRWLLRDDAGARAELAKAFEPERVERMLRAFARGARK